jgi:hypothetical protein
MVAIVIAVMIVVMREVEEIHEIADGRAILRRIVVAVGHRVGRLSRLRGEIRGRSQFFSMNFDSETWS